MKKLLTIFVMMIASFTLAACGDEDLTINLTANIDEAEVSYDAPEGLDTGNEVTIEASEVDGYTFEHWLDTDTDEVFSSEMSTTFNVVETLNLEAIYAEVDDSQTVSIQLISDEDVDLSIEPGETVDSGTEVTINVSEHDEMSFYGWVNTENDEVLAESREYSFTATDDLTLEAVFVDPQTQAVNETLDAHEGDLTHMQSFIDTFEASSTQGFELHLLVEEDNPIDPSITDVYEIHIDYAMREGDTLEKQIVFSIEGAMPEPIEFEMFVNETNNFMIYYLDLGLVLDMVEAEEATDLREILDLEGDFIQLAIPKGSDNDLFDALEEALEEAMGEEFDEEAIDTLMEIFDVFEQYFDLEYLNTYDALQTEVAQTDEEHIETTLIVNNLLVSAIFEDMIEDLYPLIKSLNPEDMPAYDDFIESDDYDDALDMIDLLEPFEILMTHDPYALDSLHISFDMLDFLSQFEDEQYLPNTMQLSITLHSKAEVDEFPGANDLMEIGEEVYQLFIMMEAVELSTALHSDESIEPGVYTLSDLEAHNYYIVNPLIDLEMSTIEITEDPRDLNITFVYKDSEAYVFEGETLSLLSDFDGFPEHLETRDDLETIIALVDDENIDFYQKLPTLIEFIMENPFEETPEMTLPEDDVEGEDFAQIERYQDSVIFYASDDGATQMLSYGVETTDLSDINDFFMNQLSEDGNFSEINGTQHEGSYMITAEYDNESAYYFDIYITEDSPYEDSVAITINRYEQE